MATKPEKTKVYDFELENDRTTDLLSEKMKGYPVVIYPDGHVEWSGVVHLEVGCTLDDVADYPLDKNTCQLKWDMIPA